MDRDEKRLEWQKAGDQQPKCTKHRETGVSNVFRFKVQLAMKMIPDIELYFQM